MSGTHLNDLSKVYLDQVAKVKKAETEADIQRWEDLGGPTPENYKPLDDSAKIKTEGYEATKKKEVLAAFKRDPKVRKRFEKAAKKDRGPGSVKNQAADDMLQTAKDIAKRKGDTSKSDDRYAYEQVDLKKNSKGRHPRDQKELERAQEYIKKNPNFGKVSEGKGYQPEIEHIKGSDLLKKKKKVDLPPHLRLDVMKKAFAHTNKVSEAKDAALEYVRNKYKGQIYDPKKKQSPEDKAKVAAERKKRQDADNKAYASRAKKAGYKSTQDYTNVVARYGSEDNYRKGKGLGT